MRSFLIPLFICSATSWLAFPSPNILNPMIVKGCVSKGNGSISVRANKRHLCAKGPLGIFNQYVKQPISYQLSSQGDSLQIELRVRLSGNENELNGILAETRACVPQIQRVWKRYGINLDLKFDSEEEQHFEHPHQLVTVAIEDGRSSSSHFAFPILKNTNEDFLLRDLYCRRVLHETGHHLGLQDRYLEIREDCPDTPIELVSHTTPVHIMARQQDARNWESMDFYPEEIYEVIKPYCVRNAGLENRPKRLHEPNV